MSSKEIFVLLEAPNALDWADFAFKIVAFIIGMGLNIAFVLVFIMAARSMWNFYTEGRHGDFPSMKIMFRRLYCRHRNISYVKSRFGFRSTCCAACGINVNKNRRMEMQR